MKRTKLGIVGCGMISSTYFAAAKRFRNIEIVACHDIIPERAVAKAEEFGARAVSLEEMLADPEIEIVLNLTPPRVHSQIDIAVISAGKHVYSEKPFGRIVGTIPIFGDFYLDISSMTNGRDEVK